jgi:hypothetical protein
MKDCRKVQHNTRRGTQRNAGFDNPDPAVQEVFMGNLNPVIRKVNRSSRNIFRKSKFNRDG